MKRKFLIPEVVQTSSLDCGPAALKALLDGFGCGVSYGQLRETCQTGLDGTSIETLEAVANQLGIEAEQIMVPLDHLLMPETNALPAIVVVTLAQGLTHFVVLWRRLGNWVQIMDPAVGRRWLRAQSFLEDVYQHTIGVNADDWFAYAQSEEFQGAFQRRQRALRLRLEPCDSWRTLACQDASLRLAASLNRNGGGVTPEILSRLARQPELIPSHYYSVAEADGQVMMRGAVLIRVKSASRQKRAEHSAQELRLPRLQVSVVFLVALLAASGGVLMEALLFRGLLDVNSGLALAGQRMAAVLAAILFSSALLLLEVPAFATGARLGRILETRLRAAFLEKLPKLSNGYFQSRPVSDMAERSHILHRLRHLPDQMRQLILACCQLVATAGGIVWLDSSAWPFMLASLAAALIPFLSARWLLAERDLRVRTHSGGLMQFYLDAMLGLMPIRAHGAAASLTRQHGALLDQWTAASIRLQRSVVLTEGLQLSILFSLVTALLLVHPAAGNQMGRVLLMAYWALNMPALGQEIATIARQYPNYRSIVLRLLEPLSAPEEEATESCALAQAPQIDFRHVHVVASGNTILTDVSATLRAGSHVAVVGSSGAGKSTLAGLLLGWAKVSSGEILVDGTRLNVEQVRVSCAWVDPAIQIWNRSLQSNLSFGGNGALDFAGILDAAALRTVLETLPQGLQTVLGENGGLVSGGEGQRVRFGRALQRRDARLVILDEPFRGLDREKRKQLLACARQHWAGATLLCITHDLSETLGFDQVLVMEGGSIIEAGPPRELAGNSESRYGRMLASERQAWSTGPWRRLWLDSGQIVGQIVEEMPASLSLEEQQSEVA